MKTVKSGVTLIIIACLVAAPETQAAEKLSKGIKQPVPQQEGTKKEAAEAQNWSPNLANSWESIKKLLNKYADMQPKKANQGWWDANIGIWTTADYDRLGELRYDVQEMSPAFADLLNPFMQEYGDLKFGSERRNLTAALDYVLPFLFGSGPLTINQVTITNEVRAAIDPKHNKPIGNKLAEILKMRKKSVEKNKVAGKPQPIPQKAPVAIPEKEHKREVEEKTAQAQTHKFKSLKELQAFYKKEMEQQAKDLMNIFFDLTGVSLANLKHEKEMAEITLVNFWKKELQKLRIKSILAQGTNHLMSIYTRPTKEQELFAQRIIKIAKELFFQEEIGHPELFFDYIDKTGYGMEVTPLYIKVEMGVNETLPDILNETTLLHEIAHIKYNDAAIQGAMHRILEEHNSASLESFMQLWSFFKEKRADVFAWTHGIQYAKGGVDYYESRKDLPVYEITHPSDPNRAALARQIYNEMLAIPKSGKAL